MGRQAGRVAVVQSNFPVLLVISLCLLLFRTTTTTKFCAGRCAPVLLFLLPRTLPLHSFTVLPSVYRLSGSSAGPSASRDCLLFPPIPLPTDAYQYLHPLNRQPFITPRCSGAALDGRFGVCCVDDSTSAAF
jgi:hypothetical protein